MIRQWIAATISCRSRSFGLIAALVLALGIASVPKPAAAETSERQARIFIGNSINNVLVILKDRTLDSPGKLAALRRILRRYFDHKTIGRFAAGLHYKRATPTQQERYIAALEEFVINTYGRRMITYSGQIDKDLKASDLFKIWDVVKVGRRDYLVRTHVKRRALKPVTIDWRLRRKENRFVIVDVIIMGISQIITYRSEFTAVIYRQKRGLAGLTESLIAKNAKLAGGRK